MVQVCTQLFWSSETEEAFDGIKGVGHVLAWARSVFTQQPVSMDLFFTRNVLCILIGFTVLTRNLFIPAGDKTALAMHSEKQSTQLSDLISLVQVILCSVHCCAHIPCLTCHAQCIPS